MKKTKKSGKKTGAADQGGIRRKDPRKAVEDAVAKTRQETKKTDPPAPPELTEAEIMSLACGYFSRGVPQARIKELMKKDHHVEMNRLDPNRLIQKAAQMGRIQYLAPLEPRLADVIKTRYCALESVDVVHTAAVNNVAYHGAKRLYHLIRRLYRLKGDGADSVHIGIAGGGTLRSFSESFRSLLVEAFSGESMFPIDDLPPILHFHSMVAGFDPTDPTTDPNAMTARFRLDEAIPIKTRFMGLQAPPVPDSEMIPKLKLQEGIKEAFEQRDDIDVVVTSLGSWHGHSMLQDLMHRSRAAVRTLERARILGDMMWRPIGEDGPIELQTPIRAMTLMELSDLSDLICRRNGKVLLLAGPCFCDKTKTRVLKSILDRKPPLVTHLVVDTRTARELVRPHKRDTI